MHTVFILIYNDSAWQITSVLDTFKLGERKKEGKKERKKTYRTMTTVARSYNATFLQIMH